MAFPKVNEWSDKVYQAGTKGGFNMLRDLEPELHQAIPDLKPYNIGLFVEDDLKNVMPMGWRHMDLGHLDFKTIDDFNKTIGLRYGIVPDASGHLTISSNFIMIMPKNYREKLAAERKKALEEQNKLSHQKAAYVHPEDPNYGDMKERAEEIASTSSKYRVQVQGEPERE